MPYYRNNRNETVYKPSLFAKEYLPTWDEIYNQWWKNRIFHYDPMDPSHNLPGGEVDDLYTRECSYWKRPKRKLLLCWLINQFNKMLFEDNDEVSLDIHPWKELVLDILNDITEANYVDIAFTWATMDDFVNDTSDYVLAIDPIKNTYITQHLPVVKDGKFEMPVIWYQSEPETSPRAGERSIFASNHPHTDIDAMVHPFVMCIQAIKADGTYSTFCLFDPDNRSNYPEDGSIFIKIVECLLSEVLYYFKEPIGWKSVEGELIADPDATRPGCNYTAGIDAAL